MNAPLLAPTQDIPNVHAHLGVSTTEYRIVGNLAAVQNMIAVLFEQYAPKDYGTRVHEIEQRADGNYHARISRANEAVE